MTIGIAAMIAKKKIKLPMPNSDLMIQPMAAKGRRKGCGKGGRR